MDPRKLDRDETLRRYDQLLAAGDLLYTPSTTVVELTDGGLPTKLIKGNAAVKFEFRVTPAQKTKPAFPKEDESEEAAPETSADPLAESDKNEKSVESDIDSGTPQWHLASVHGTHRLVFNKFCIYRPQYILLTADASYKQTAPLDRQDFQAAWTMLFELQTPHYVIFNCGAAAGGSRMHKHMQIFEQDGDELLPDKMLRDPAIRESIPYRYALQPLDGFALMTLKGDTATLLVQLYEKHVKYCAEMLKMSKDAVTDIPHNVILTQRWMMTIPRTQAGIEAATANAAGMIGLVWVPEDSVIDLWKQLGPREVLSKLGVSKA